MTKTLLFLCALTLAWIAAACSGSSTTPSTTTTTAPSSPINDTFFSSVAPGGTTIHTFTANAGVITVTLQSSGPPDGIAISFGIGIPTTGGRRCGLNTTLTAAPSPNASLSAAVDAGSYCVEVYDPGRLTAQTSFVLMITRP